MDLLTRQNGGGRHCQSSLKHTLSVLILIPATIAIGFMSIVILREMRAKHKADHVRSIIEYMAQAGFFIHELQKERGESFGFIEEKGLTLSEELSAQRLLTDQKYTEMKTYLASFDIRQYGHKFALHSNRFLEKLSGLPSIRENITSLSITKDQSMTFYTEVIQEIIESFQSANVSINDSALSFPFTACVNFIMAKEMAGIERAIMAGFAADDKPLSLLDMQKWQRVLNGQDALFSAFKHQATEVIQKKYNNVDGANAKAIENIRKRIYDKHDEGNYGLAFADVFAAATRRIDELKGVEDDQLQEILDNAVKTSSEKTMSLVIYATLTGVSITGMYVLCFLIAGSITRPVTVLTRMARRIADGHLDQEIVVESRNEIGELAFNFNQMCVDLKEKTVSKKELEKRVIERTEALENTNNELKKEITRRKLMEERLRKLYGAVEQSRSSIMIADTDGNIEYVNPRFAQLTGYSSGEIIGKNTDILGSGNMINEAYGSLRDAIMSRKVWEGEFLTKKKNGESFWEHATISPVRNNGGTITHFLWVKEDVTERKRMEEQINASLREKEELLKEIHHRVKNNLQIISGLLYLSRKRARNRETIDILSEASGRIDSIALVHSLLYKSDSFNEVNMRTHIERLSENLSQIYAQDMNVEVVIAPTDVCLPVSTAVPCALVLNELITNAYTHAFREGRKGRLELSIVRVDKGNIIVRIRDSGIGIPENVDINETLSMGLLLVRNIVKEQLKGKLQMVRNKGTEFVIEFYEQGG